MNTKLQYDEMLKEIGRHAQDSEITMTSHFSAAERYNQISSIFISTPSIVLSAVLLALLSLPFNSNSTLSSYSFSIYRFITIIISVLLTILTGLNAAFNFKDKAKRHENAGIKYNLLRRTCLSWKTNFPHEDCDLNKAMVEVEEIRRRINEYNWDSPSPPTWAYYLGQKQREKGMTKYDEKVAPDPVFIAEDSKKV